MIKWISAVCILCMCGLASAEMVQGIDIDFVTIGDAGNSGDYSSTANPSGCGAVAYEYRIATYEITNSQWSTFVDTAGAPTGGSSWAYTDGDSAWTGSDIPVTCISWLEAVQFCNYLTSGDKYSGAYTFDVSGNFTGVDRNSAVSLYGTVYALPTEDEWYKAAYYSTSTGTFTYYADGSDSTDVPISNVESLYDSTEPWDVGDGVQEQNGTYDMMGNVWEWNESVVDGVYGVRGGAYYDYNNSVEYLSSDYRSRASEYLQLEYVGFRVVEIVPEPATMILLGLGGVIAVRVRFKGV